MGIEEDKEMSLTPSSEDVIQALLDYFVEPVLPPKMFHQSPSLDQQLSVAKQVRAVVILYNYYQRKLQPQLEFLDLVSFCKLIVVLKPALLPFMKLMHHSDLSQLVDLENLLSPTEKSIMDACDLCRVLGASEYIPGIEGWPITKLAVLLIDSRMENCLLLPSTATKGVWSIIEKDLGVLNVSSEGTLVPEYTNKRSGTFKQQTYNQGINASLLQQLALSAVMELAGIDQSNIKVLESHVIYPLSEEASTACVYVMQCTQSICQGFQVPIKDVVDRLQGPLLKMTSNGWMLGSLAEYFQLFPYAGILSDLIPGESDVNRATYSRIRVDALNHGEINSSPLHVSRDCKDKNLSLENLVKVKQQMTNAYSAEGSKGVSTVVTKMETSNATKSAGDKHNDESAAEICNQGPISASLNGTPAADCKHVPCETNFKDVEKLKNLLAKKGTAISETAVRVLSQEIEEMLHQQRILEDKIALCSRDIQKIINGNEDTLALKIQAIIDFCNDTCLKGKTEIQGETHQQCDVQKTNQCSRRNRLQGDILNYQSPSQELDYICHVNNWRLPRYSVSTSTGEFVANVMVKETDFEFSCKGALLSTPSAARDSAAALLIAKINEMASQTEHLLISTRHYQETH